MTQIIISFLIIGVAFVFRYIINIILVRWLGAQLFGDYSVVVATLQFLSTIALIGFDYNIIKFLPAYIAKKDWSSASGLMYYTRKMTLIAQAFILLAGIFLSVFVSQVLNMGMESIYYFIFAFIWISPFCSIVNIRSKAMRSMGYIFTSQLLLDFGQPVLMILVLGIASYWERPLIILEAIILYCCSFIFVMFTQKLIIHWKAPPQLFKEPRVFHKKIWFKNALKLLATNFFVLSAQSVSLIISRVFDVNKNNVGILAAIFVICSVFYLIYSSINSTVAPKMSEALKQNDIDQVKKMIHQSQLFAICGGGCVFFVLVFFGQKLLGHFGQNFDQGFAALLIIAIAYVYTIFFEMSNRFLQYNNHVNRFFLLFVGIVNITHIILSILLTKLYGLNGTALAFGLAMWILSFFYAVKTRKLLWRKV